MLLGTGQAAENPTVCRKTRGKSVRFKEREAKFMYCPKQKGLNCSKRL